MPGSRRKKPDGPPEPDLAVPQKTTNGVVSRNESPSSIEFSRDAKGQPRWSIKLYGENEDMDDLLDQIKELDQRLQKEL